MQFGQNWGPSFATAVHVCLQVLTIEQEAFLDSHSYPWCPDIWQMAQLLTVGKAEPDVKDSTANLDMSGVALNTLFAREDWLPAVGPATQSSWPWAATQA